MLQPVTKRPVRLVSRAQPCRVLCRYTRGQPEVLLNLRGYSDEVPADCTRLDSCKYIYLGGQQFQGQQVRLVFRFEDGFLRDLTVVSPLHQIEGESQRNPLEYAFHLFFRSRGTVPIQNGTDALSQEGQRAKARSEMVAQKMGEFMAERESLFFNEAIGFLKDDSVASKRKQTSEQATVLLGKGGKRKLGSLGPLFDLIKGEAGQLYRINR